QPYRHACETEDLRYGDPERAVSRVTGKAAGARGDQGRHRAPGQERRQAQGLGRSALGPDQLEGIPVPPLIELSERDVIGPRAAARGLFFFHGVCMSLVFRNGTIVLEDRLLEGSEVEIDDERIQAIRPAATANGNVVDLAGGYLVPGFIDLHI